MYERFLKLLTEKKISAYKVSKDTHISQATFSAWKNGSRQPKVDKLQKIAAYFNVSLEWLMGNTDVRNANSSNIKKELDVIPPSSKSNENTIQLSTDEQELLKLYRELPYEGKATIKAIVQNQYDLYVKPKCNEKAI